MAVSDGYQPVVNEQRCPAEVDRGVARRRLIPSRPQSPLQLDVLTLDAGARLALGHDRDRHELVYVLEGELTLGSTRERPGATAIGPDTAFLVDGPVTVSPSPSASAPAAVRLAVFAAGPACDEHAPLGERVMSVRLEASDAESATGHRSFQVLLGPDNGCCRATMFVGFVPPGAAPWHFHQYDEIVYLLDGSGAYHQAGGTQPTRPGSAVRIPPRTVHINENGTDADMRVLGVFTPAGSPAAAYLAGDPRQPVSARGTPA